MARRGRSSSGGGGGSSTVIHDGIGPVLGYLVVSTAANVAEAFYSGAQEVEYFAKANAPWSDITGQARDGLVASVTLEGGEVVLELTQTVDHGYWLEVAMDQRYAIIMPTLEALGPEILRDAGAGVFATGSSF